LGNCFPGRSDGFLTEKIAHVIFNEFLLKSNFWIDLHSGLAVGLQTSNVTPVAHVSPYTARAVRPKNGGVCHIKVNMRNLVKQGDLFAEITGPFGKIEECYAPVDGLVYRRMANGVVYPSAELGWIAIIENVLRNH